MELTLNLGYTPSGQSIVARNLNNSHIFISGQSGGGKSYFLKKLIVQAANQGALVLVPDYSSDFLGYVPPDDLRFQRIDVTSPEFALNPLSGLPGQSPDARAQQLLSALHSVFRMGPRATVSLRCFTAEYLADTNSPTLSGLLNHISAVKDAGKGLEAAKEPLQLLTSMVHCGNQPISLDLEKPGLIVLSFPQLFDQNLCKLLVELFLQTLWTTHTPNYPPLILVLDECQRLNWGTNSMAGRVLREGRKFGIGGWFSSQWIDHKGAVAALGQAAIQAHFRPDDQHSNELAKRLCCFAHPSDLSQYQRLIQGLHRGQFLWTSPSGKCVKIQVPA